MKAKESLFLLLSGITAFTVLMTGCVKQPDYSGPDDNGQGGGNGFDYATVADVKINVDYSMKGNKAVFEVFAENPVIEKDGLLVRKEGVKSLLKAYTDRDSKYSGVVNLPTAARKVWLYSESYGLPICIEAEVTTAGISVDLQTIYASSDRANAGKSAAAQVLSTRAASANNPFNIQQLGKWTWNGLPLYITGETFDGDFFPIYTNIPDGLTNRIQNVLMPGTDNSSYAKPTEVVNLNVTKDAHLTLVFAAELAGWRNAIGYYFYDTKNPPKSMGELDLMPKYVAFPNCSSFISNFSDGSAAPLRHGEQLQLKYFKDGNATDVFPAGTTVGWFLIPDGYKIWPESSTGKLDLTGAAYSIRYSNSECNGENARYMVSLYDKVSGKTVLGFEDGGDNDYKDVLFYVDSDPADAIYDPDRPTTDPDDEKYPDITGDPIEGTLAFEDLWPSQGDYDMNDVVVAYSTTFTTDKDNKLIAMKDVFTPLHSGGSLKSAFGYQLDMPTTAVKNVTIDHFSSSAQTVGGLESNQSKAVIMLFDDIHQAVAQGPITVVTELDGSVSGGRSHWLHDTRAGE
ncbi:LruC domain-containing protein [Alistipes indistinctus]|uniref:LruC domain-containing protein n=1 Tax=Alistipes indistinctus TaxID=626932 RepID=UPI003AAE1F5A